MLEKITYNLVSGRTCQKKKYSTLNFTLSLGLNYIPMYSSFQENYIQNLYIILAGVVRYPFRFYMHSKYYKRIFCGF